MRRRPKTSVKLLIVPVLKQLLCIQEKIEQIYPSMAWCWWHYYISSIDLSTLDHSVNDIASTESVNLDMMENTSLVEGTDLVRARKRVNLDRS